MTITGTKINDVKFATLQEERWEHFGSRTYRCRKHDTFFDPAEEPCWECYDECTEET